MTEGLETALTRLNGSTNLSQTFAGTICGSFETRYNCAHSSPVCELYAHLRHEDVSDAALLHASTYVSIRPHTSQHTSVYSSGSRPPPQTPICVLSPSIVVFVTRMADSHARHARLPRVHVKGAVCIITFTKAKGSGPHHSSTFFVVYYKSIKRELQTKPKSRVGQKYHTDPRRTSTMPPLPGRVQR